MGLKVANQYPSDERVAERLMSSYQVMNEYQNDEQIPEWWTCIQAIAKYRIEW